MNPNDKGVIEAARLLQDRFASGEIDPEIFRAPSE